MSITVKDSSNMNRRIVAITLSIIVSISAFGQGVGVFEFTNVGTTADRHIYVGEYLGPVKASGIAYRIAIYCGPAGTTDEAALQQLGGSSGFLTAEGAGQFIGGGRTLFGLSEDGGVVTLQAR